ncbi:hypothetical protein PsorP6_015864 [Peronosclerospora sorghi]|uniref:Uncharacterized protein n=1 Tax=Peronosclerospora sorghi TaxID=230839 RepID=A0ACC0WMD2_9STRA|nr:hypothetical protein PsorP6_015864 [Peronosclerospora sorghi]
MPPIRKHVLVIGSVNADVVVEIPRLPRRGETLCASKVDTGTFVPGGKGSNQAAAARQFMGQRHATLSVQFVGQFGNDTYGSVLEQTLEGLDVDTALSGHAACASGQAFVFIYPTGDNSIIVVKGANDVWPTALAPALVNAIHAASIVLLQCEIPQRVNTLVARAASDANVPILWDTGGEDTTIPRDLLPLLTYVCPNETELARLTAREVKTLDDAVVAAKVLQEEGGRHVLVTLGSNGSVFVPADGSTFLHQACFHVANVVDTTGAGDCYRGVFAVAVAEGRDVHDCMVLATAASALCVQRPGALPSLPSRDDVRAFLNANASCYTLKRDFI